MDAQACINTYQTLLSGEVVYIDPAEGKVTPHQINVPKLKKKSLELLKSYESNGSLEVFSDYAASLIFLGDLQKAKKICFDIERQKPDLYTTASNLGTIYELIGQPDSAYLWIKKSVEINPNSHRGSEWIHLKILEYKMEGSNNYEKSILGLDFREELIINNKENYNLKEMKGHIWHQLRERTTFVKPKDEIVGNIYFDLGNVLALHQSVESALQSYEMAQEYGYDSDLLRKRTKAFKKLASKASAKQSADNLKRSAGRLRGMAMELITIGGGLLLLFFASILGFFWYKR